LDWLKKGAQPTDIVLSLVKNFKALEGTSEKQGEQLNK